MNVLITGAGGFIGTHLSEYLEKEKRHTVFKVQSRLRNLNANNAIIMDLTDKKQSLSFFNEFKKSQNIDTIIHLASRLSSANEVNDINILYDNLKISETVAEITKILLPEKVINFSSIAVYPNKDGIYNETSEIRTSFNKECYYGLSKFCSENIFDFILRNECLFICHLRIAQVYGDGMRKDRLMSILTEELKNKNTITVFGNGERVSNFIHIKKLLTIIDFFLESNLNGIYNVGDEQLSYMELARNLICQHGNKESKIINIPKGLKVKCYYDTSKFKNLIESNNCDM